MVFQVVGLAKKLNVNEPTSAKIAHSKETELPPDAMSSSGVMSLEEFLGDKAMAAARGEVSVDELEQEGREGGGGGGGGGGGEGTEEAKETNDVPDTLEGLC